MWLGIGPVRGTHQTLVIHSSDQRRLAILFLSRHPVLLQPRTVEFNVQGNPAGCSVHPFDLLLWPSGASPVGPTGAVG